MSSWAKPGVRCVCVDVASLPGRVWHPKSDVLVVGKVYEVRAVEPAILCDGMAIRLVGMRNFYGGDEIGYSIRRFRPLITRTQEQDLELFRPLLTDLPVGVDA